MSSHKRIRGCNPGARKIRELSATRRRAAASISSMALLLVVSKFNGSSGFVSSVGKGHGTILTRRNFRHTEAGDVDSLTVDAEVAAAAAAVNLFVASSPVVSSPAFKNMPPWLRPKGHLAQENLVALRDAMTNSYLTESQAMKVIYAIEEASGGDMNKIAGAAEFCLILVETMEMGPQALVAAAYHYSTCVTAREQGNWSLASHSTSSIWDDHDYSHHALESFGEDAVRVARNAARLKQVENVAASVMQNSGKSARAVPDTHDSENLFSLLLAETTDWRALAIRSAACLYRLRGLLAVRSESEFSVSSEHPSLTPEEVRISREALNIYAPLASRLGMHRLKNELEGAAFRILYRRQYETVTSLALEKRWKKGSVCRSCGIIAQSEHQGYISIREGMKSLLNEVTERVSSVLREDRDFREHAKNVVVAARVKEPFSLWKKMLRLGAKHILDVPDALALRVVVDAKKLSPDEDIEVTRARERALCYYVQMLCTNRWAPLPDHSRFKDYIKRPKANGYQSLHYTANIHWNDEDWPFEIQVRSGEMHKVAEYGLAAHWDYKAHAKKSNNNRRSTADRELRKIDQSSDAYLKGLQEWHWQQQSQGKETREKISALRRSREDMALFGNDDYAHQSDDEMSVVRSERVRARAERLAPYIEALEAAQLDLARENVFVFLSSSSSNPMHSEGKVLALPAGACVLDALREGERRFGITMKWSDARTPGVVHNGVMSSVTKKLSNGDVLTVPMFSESTGEMVKMP